MKITLYCTLCTERTEAEINTGKWTTRSGEIEIEESLCESHSPVNEFFEFVCPGCVGSWPNCSLAQSILYKEVKIKPDELAQISLGICPMRTNGTFSFSAENGIGDIDISSLAPKESSRIFAGIITDLLSKEEPISEKPGR